MHPLQRDTDTVIVCEADWPVVLRWYGDKVPSLFGDLAEEKGADKLKAEYEKTLEFEENVNPSSTRDRHRLCLSSLPPVAR